MWKDTQETTTTVTSGIWKWGKGSTEFTFFSIFCTITNFSIRCNINIMINLKFDYGDRQPVFKPWPLHLLDVSAWVIT